MSSCIRSLFLTMALTVVVPVLTASVASAGEGDKMDKPADSDMGDKGNTGTMKKGKAHKKDGMDKDKGDMNKGDKGKSM